MIPGDELTWGHTLFNRKNRKDIYILLQLVPCTNRMEKKCVCKRPVYKLVPGATWICGRAILKRIALLFTLIYKKEENDDKPVLHGIPGMQLHKVNSV